MELAAQRLRRAAAAIGALSQWRLGPDVPLPLGVSLDDIERMCAELIERLLALALPNE